MPFYFLASDLSEVGEELPTEDGISRTSGSSSLDLDQTESVPPDDGSSIHAGSSHGNQVKKCCLKCKLWHKKKCNMKKSAKISAS